MNADSGLRLEMLKVDGGMTSDNLPMQFVADVLDVPVVRPMVAETVSLGAAYAAGLAVGYWPDLEGLRANWHRAAEWQPQVDRVRCPPSTRTGSAPSSAPSTGSSHPPDDCYSPGSTTLPSSSSPNDGLCAISHACPSRSRKPPAYPP